MKRKQRLLPLVLMGFGGLLLALVAVWLATGGIPGLGSAEEQDFTVETIPRVSVKDAYAALVTGSAVFVDVRGEESFVAARVPGAANIPLAEITARYKELSTDDWIITYCT